MGEGSSLFKKRGFVIVGRIIVALIFLAMISGGLWMLGQVLDSVVILGRSTVNIPGFPASVSVWFYHDVSYTLLWAAYVGLVVWEIRPWRPGQITGWRFVIILFGFALLTAALWISQDLMNAVLDLHRTTVDLPFFAGTLDEYQTRDLVFALVALSYVGFYALISATKQE